METSENRPFSIFSHPYQDIIIKLFEMLHNVNKGAQF